MSAKPVLPATLRRLPRPAGEAKRRAVALITDRSRLDAIVCEREITAAARRALAVTSVAELDHRARQIRLSYAPDPRCACGERFQHATNCPDDTEGN